MGARPLLFLVSLVPSTGLGTEIFNRCSWNQYNERHVWAGPRRTVHSMENSLIEGTCLIIGTEGRGHLWVLGLPGERMALLERGNLLGSVAGHREFSQTC